MAAPGFRFSFGDFVQAISLLNDVRKALRDTGGAKDEFKHVSVDLQHLEILLEQLNQGKWDQCCDLGHLNAVKGMALTCRLPLQEFLAKVEKYKVLQRDDLSSFKDILGSGRRKIEWTVKMKEEVENFRAFIVAKVVSISLLLQLHVISAISSLDSRTKTIEESTAASQAHQFDYKEAVNRTAEEVRNIATAQTSIKQEISQLVQICTGTNVGVVDFRTLIQVRHTDVKLQLNRIEQQQSRGILVISSTSREIISHISRMESILRQLLRVFGGFSLAALNLLQSILRTDLEIHALLRQIQNHLPPTPRRAVNNSFIFTDALGRTQELEYQWFKHWEVFESMLKCEFRRLPGEKRVLLGQYYILDAKRKSIDIFPHRWEQSVFPGSEINMSMLITGQLFEPGLCPRPDCKAKNPLPTDGSMLVICSICQLEYHCIGVAFPASPLGNGSSKTKSTFGTELPSPLKISSDLNSDSTNEPAYTSPLEKFSRDDNDLEAFKSVHIQTPSKQFAKKCAVRLRWKPWEKLGRRYWHIRAVQSWESWDLTANQFLLQIPYEHHMHIEFAPGNYESNPNFKYFVLVIQVGNVDNRYPADVSARIVGADVWNRVNVPTSGFRRKEDLALEALPPMNGKDGHISLAGYDISVSVILVKVGNEQPYHCVFLDWEANEDNNSSREISAGTNDARLKKD